MTTTVRVARRTAAVIFAVFALAALAKYLLATNEAPSARGNDGEPEGGLALGYLVAAVLAFASAGWRAAGSYGWAHALGSIVAITGLCAIAFWLVDRSQKFPIGEGAYGTRTVTLLVLAGAALLLAVAVTVSPARRTAAS